jgi:hypothetical protein
MTHNIDGPIPKSLRAANDAYRIQLLEREDATRYRWLRQHWNGFSSIYGPDGNVEMLYLYGNPDWTVDFAKSLDAAIDRAYQSCPLPPPPNETSSNP